MQHGHAPKSGRSAEYMAWQNLIQRCTNPNFKQYADYGGRGIKVHRAWLGRGGFRAFLKEIGRRPSSRHTIDRINNDRGYEPGNIRWATRVSQNRNTSKNVMLTVRDETLSLAEWSERTGIGHSTLRARIALGWASDTVVLTPVRRMRRSKV
jgi:hypothetical protein